MGIEHIQKEDLAQATAEKEQEQAKPVYTEAQVREIKQQLEAETLAAKDRLRKEIEELRNDCAWYSQRYNAVRKALLAMLEADAPRQRNKFDGPTFNPAALGS